MRTALRFILFVKVHMLQTEGGRVWQVEQTLLTPSFISATIVDLSGSHIGNIQSVEYVIL